jgi:hypothetical protein
MVLWGSVALFATLFVLLAYEVGASLAPSTTAAARPALVRKVVKRRVVTTIVPTPGRSSVSASPASTSESGAEPITTGAS